MVWVIQVQCNTGHQSIFGSHENQEWSVSQKELMGDNDHHHHGDGPHGKALLLHIST